MSPALAREPVHDDKTEPLLAFVSDTDSRQALSELALERDIPETLLAEGGIDDALAAAANGRHPRALLADIDEAEDAIRDIRTLTAALPHTRIIALGSQNDVSLYRALQEAGARDYLTKPLNPKELSRILDMPDLPALTTAAATRTGGKSLAVVGIRGGVGASTLAVNLAWLLAHKHRRPTALVDLDLQYGCCALALDLLPNHGLREVLESPSRIDEMLIASATIKESDQLDVLAGEEAFDDPAVVSPHALEILIHTLERDHEYVVLDTPRSLAGQMANLTETVDTLVLVTDLTLAGMRDTVRWLEQLGEIPDDHRRLLVANRVGEAKTDITRREFERAVGVGIDLELPWDPRAQQAANTGKAMAAMTGKSKLAQALANGVCGLTGMAAERRRGLRLFGKAAA